MNKPLTASLIKSHVNELFGVDQISDKELQLQAERMFHEVLQHFNKKMSAAGCKISNKSGELFQQRAFCEIYIDKNFETDKQREKIIKNYIKKFLTAFPSVCCNFKYFSWGAKISISFDETISNNFKDYGKNFLEIEINNMIQGNYIGVVVDFVDDWRYVELYDFKNYYYYFINNNNDLSIILMEITNQMKELIDLTAKAIRLTPVG